MTIIPSRSTGAWSENRMPSTPAQPWMPVTACAPAVTGSSVPMPSPYPKITVPERVSVAEKLTGSVYSVRSG